MRKRGPRLSRRFSGSLASLSGVAERHLAVGGGVQHLAVEALDVPAALAEIDGQPVEQLRVRGRFALAAEIVGGLDQAHAENLLPHAVDGHARGERVVFGEEPAGEAEAIARQRGGHRRQHRGGAGFHAVALLVVGAAIESVGERLLVRALFHDQRRGAAAGDFAEVEIEAVLLGGELAIGLVGAGEEPLEQVLARSGAEVRGGLGERGGGRGPVAEQARIGFREHAVEEAEIGDGAAGEGAAQDDAVFDFDAAVEARVARAEPLQQPPAGR